MNAEDLDAQRFAEQFKQIENEIQKAIIGQKDIVRNVLVAMLAGGNVLLQGLPGLGKTQLVKTIGKTLSLSFSRIQFTPDLMPADVTGTDVFLKNTDGSSGFSFQKGPVFANIVLADEINRATPKTQSSLLEAMQEKTVTSGITTHVLPKPFFVLATQNPLEMEGTYPLPEAQTDRFLFQLNVPYPSREELIDILDLTQGSTLPELFPVIDGDTLLAMTETAKCVPVAKPVASYIAEIVLKTHPDSEYATDEIKKYVRYGASPRAGQAILSCAKIYALLNGRFNVSYSDVNSLLLPVLRHRLILNFEAAADGITADALIQNLANHGFEREVKTVN